jgi:hypothetical protein
VGHGESARFLLFMAVCRQVAKSVGGGIDADLNKSSGGRPMFLCVARKPATAPVTAIAVVFGATGEFFPPGAEGFSLPVVLAAWNSFHHLEFANAVQAFSPLNNIRRESLPILTPGQQGRRCGATCLRTASTVVVSLCVYSL